jgi:hypothetical protein
VAEGLKRLVLLALAALALCAGAFAAGRYTASQAARVETKVEYRDRVEYRERVVEKKVEGPVRVQVVTRTIPGPAGPERIVVRTVERGPVVTDRVQDGQGKVEEQLHSATITTSQPRWLLGASVGASPSLALRYGGQLAYRVAGPFWLGIAADTEPSVRLQLMGTF